MRRSFLLVTLLFFAASTLTASEERTPAPDFELVTLDGDTIHLSDYRGKVVILDFWATWCAPCRMEIPSYVELMKTYKDSGLVIIGIAISDRCSRVKDFVKALRVNYPVAMGDRKIISDFGGITEIPTTFVVDKLGRIYRKYIGYRPKTIFEQNIKKLLKEKYGKKKSS